MKGLELAKTVQHQRGWPDGGLRDGGLIRDLVKSLSFWGSGRPRAAQKPFKKVRGKAP